MKKILSFFLCALCVVVAGCGSSTPAPTLNLNGTQALDAGQSVNITSNEDVTWTLSGLGSLANQSARSVTYNAPAVGSFIARRAAAKSSAVSFASSSDPTATITATSKTSTSKVTILTINLTEPPVIPAATLQNGIVGTAYNQTIAVTGGAGTLTFAVSTGSLPAGLALSSAGAITGTPTTVGTSSFTIKVTDSSVSGALSATQNFSITVNQAPAITSANSVTFVVGTAGTFTVTTTGTPTPSLAATGVLPTGVTFKDNGNGTGTLSGTPAPGTAANYSITFTASNGIGTAATQNFTLTVGQPAAISSANAATFTAGTAGTFSVTTMGFPAPSLTETGALPSGVTFVDNGNGSATLAGTPAANTGGTYAITIKAHNGIGTDATQSFTLTVNQAAAITSAASATFIVGTAGTFTVTTTGFPKPALSESGTLPTGVTFTPATGVLSGTPAAGTAGSYPITFTASNGIGTNAVQNFTLTVDQAPAITSANSTTFTVGTAGTFTVTATGVPAPTLSESGTLPSGVSFNATTGVLSGTPAAGTGGVYPITFTAANGVGANAVQPFTLTVDQAPAFTSATSTTFTVGAAGTFTVTATGFPTPALTESGTLPTGVSFNASTGALSGTPATGTAGSYPITFTAANGVGANAVQSFTLTVDQAPAITSASSTTFTVGTAGSFTVTATGVPAPTLSETGTLPGGVTFNASTGVLSGTPAAGTGGTYAIKFTASNGVGTNAVQNFTLTVDQAPAFTSATSATFTVGAAGTFTVTTTGPPPPAITETGTLPSGVTFKDNGDGTGTLSGTPVSGSQGTFSLTFTASNGIAPNAVQTFTLTVDQAPVFTSASSTTFTVGVAGTFTVTAGGVPAPTISEAGTLPTGVTFNTSTNALSGTPAAGTGGTYPITFTAHNGAGANATQNFTLTVDQAPAITSANNATFTVGAAGSFTVTATGFPAPTFTETGTLPMGVSLSPSGLLSGTPASGTGGTYTITITAANGVGTNATQSFTLTVNTASVITSANATTFTVGTAGTFTVTATGTPKPTLSESGNLPTGVTFTPSTGVLSGTPATGTGGVYPITFTASNGVGTNAVQNFTLTVDQAPAITSANNATFTVGAAGSFTVTATGFPAPTFTETGALPTGVTLSTTGVLSGTPAAGTGGTYPITITAANGVGTNATQSFTLTVNTAPMITSANATTFTVGTAGTFTVTATGTPKPTLSESGTLPVGVNFTPSTGVLSGTPATGTGGVYPITFTASNGVGANAVQNFTLTVDEAPAITSANNATFILNALGTFTVTTTGFPLDPITETGTLPAGVTFVDNGNNTATLSGTPTSTTGSPFSITFTASNGVGTAATQNFTLTVTTGPTVVSTAAPQVFAGDPPIAIPITVTNDVAGDTLTATLTVDANTGLACTTATCGSFNGSLSATATGTSGGGSYSVTYTPPPAAGFATQTFPTLVVHSSLNPAYPNTFDDTDFIEVDPAGARLVTISGLPGHIVAGSAPRTVTVTVLNDATAPNGVVVSALTASGYACSNAAAAINLCGTISAPSGPVVSGTTSTTTFTYTPPPPVAAPATSPPPPYDRPRVQATSVGDNTHSVTRAFQVSNNPPPAGTSLILSPGTVFSSALAAPGAAPLTIFGSLVIDTGNSRRVTWTLKDTTGADCTGPCGTLTSQLDTGNGDGITTGIGISTQINYTPPSSVPTVAAELTPKITATSVDDNTQTASFTFTIVDGSCGTGHESLLSGSGPYAFLIRGGGQVAGYAALIGSFGTNGTGGITGGQWDFNESAGPFTTGQAITSTGSSYTVGTDNRACIVLTDGFNVLNLRGSVGALVGTPSVATEGQLVLFNDNNGRRIRASGVLMKQDSTSFATNKFSGSYAFGEEGVDSSGGRFAGAGVVTSDGALHITNLIGDFDDAGVATGAVTGGSGTYTAPNANGRATATTTLTVLGRTSTTHLVVYLVSSNEALMMATDSIASGSTIFSGELKKQTGPFMPTTLDNSNVAVYMKGIGSMGGNAALIGQLTFTTNGNATFTQDVNDNGLQPEKVGPVIGVIETSGRATFTGTGAGKHPAIIYLVDSSSAFIVGTSGAVESGFGEKQAVGPFNDASLNGLFFFLGSAMHNGSPYEVGTATFDGAGSVNGTSNQSSSNGFSTSIISPATGGTYSFLSGATPLGRGTVGTNSIAYVISGSKLIFMSTSTDPEVFVIQK